jgi:RsiW-degrading membrane proteinase PrsW (M82 family)
VSAPSSTERQLAAIDAAGWGEPVTFVQPRNLAFWVYVVFVGIGTVYYVQRLAELPSTYNSTIVASLLLWTAYTIPWVILLRRADRYEREPAKLAVLAFVWGGFAATYGIAIHANAALREIYATVISPAFALNWSAPLSAPLVEETAKGVGLLLLMALASHAIRSAFDGLVLGAFIGVAFQVVENVYYALGAAQTTFGSDNMAGVMSTLLERGILTGLFSHALFSALFCAGLVYLVGTPAEPRRVGRGLVLVVGTVVGHGLFDAVATHIGFTEVLIGLNLLELVAIVVAFKMTVGRERGWLHDVLAPEVESGVITEDELTAATGTRRQRRKFVRSKDNGLGRRKARAVLVAAGDLADAIAASRATETDEVAFARSEIARLRGLSPDARDPRPG